MLSRHFLRLFSLSLLAALALSLAAAAQDVFIDDFESYPLGTTFPCCYPSTSNPGGWEILYSGRSMGDQVVVPDPQDPGNQAVQLWGRYMWSAVIQRRFESTSPVIGWSFRILISEKGDYYAEGPCFNRYHGEYPPYDYWGTGYGFVYFFHRTSLPDTPADHGEIWSEAQTTLLGTWQPGRWYDVTVVLDRDPASSTYRTYGVWIDGELAGTDLPLTPICRSGPGGWICDGEKHPDRIDSVALTSGHDGVKVYYDDVAVFEPGVGYWLTRAEDAVADLFEGAVLNRGQANALSKKLEHARKKLDAGQPWVAENLLYAFLDQVESLVAEGVLAGAEGDALRRPAEQALAVLLVI